MVSRGGRNGPRVKELVTYEEEMKVFVIANG